MHSGSSRAIAMLAFLVLASCVNGEFTIKKNSSGSALVDKEELIFDKIELGSLDDYSPIATTPTKFDLEIGGCKVAMSGFQVSKDSIQYAINGESLTGLKTITATKDKIEFTGSDVRKANCGAKFESVDKQFKVNVKLSDMKPNFVLTSSKASSYGESGSGAGTAIVIILLLLLVLAAAGGVGFYFYRKKKKAQGQMATARELETADNKTAIPQSV